jgi:cyclophilin family peptidyl-prolyl cis-trans isomerase
VGNDVYENYCGMSFWPYSTHNTVVGNHIHDHPGCGLAFKAYSNQNHILGNNLSNNLEWGVMLGFGPTMRNVVAGNTICGTTGGQMNWFNGSGLVVSLGFFNTVRDNTFMGNKNDVYYENALFNLFSGNFWEGHPGGIKLIAGHFCQPYLYWPEATFPWATVDWRPAVRPVTFPFGSIAVISTSLGGMAVGLYVDELPVTTENFVRLADDGFFAGLVFHRVIDDFVIQGGGYYPDGRHKQSPYGPIVLETHPTIIHVDGAISMARTSNPDSATSQFFICDGAQHHLDGNYAAFGVLVGDMTVLCTIAGAETATRNGMADWPVTDVVMYDVSVIRHYP